MKQFDNFKNDNAGIGTIEIILILVILIALIVLFKGEITKIVEKAFDSISNNADLIMK